MLDVGCYLPTFSRPGLIVNDVDRSGGACRHTRVDMCTKQRGGGGVGVAVGVEQGLSVQVCAKFHSNAKVFPFNTLLTTSQVPVMM